jgi:hypothetical protein
LSPSPPSTKPFIVTLDGHLEILPAKRLAIWILLVAEKDIVEIMAGIFLMISK